MVPAVLDLVVDIIALISDVLNLGVDLGDLVADVLVLGVGRESVLGIEWYRGAVNARCLTMEDALERVSAAVCLETPRATGGV